MQRRNVPILAVTVAAMVASRLTWERLLPTYYTDLGATDAQVGLAFSLLAASLALFQLVGGLIADWAGRKPVAVLPVFGIALALAWMARAQDWRQLLVGHLAFGVFASAQSPGFNTLLAESVPERERGRAFGIVTLGSRIANATGPALGAWLLLRTDLSTLLWGTVGVSVVISLARLLLVRETLDRRGPSTGGLSAGADVNWRGVVWFLFVGTLYATLFNLLSGGPFIALHAREALHLDGVRTNLLFAVGDGAAILSALLVGRLGDRIGHRWLLGLAALLLGTGMLAWALLPAGWAGTACFALATAAVPAAAIAYNALLSGVVEGPRRGAFIGLMGTISGLLGSPASRIGAELRMAGGSAAPFGAALLLGGLLVTALFFFPSLRCQERGEGGGPFSH